jgi:hypothetical protein
MMKAIMIAYDGRVKVLNGENLCLKHNYKEWKRKVARVTAQISKGKDKSKASYSMAERISR